MTVGQFVNQMNDNQHDLYIRYNDEVIHYGNNDLVPEELASKTIYKVLSEDTIEITDLPRWADVTRVAVNKDELLMRKAMLRTFRQARNDGKISDDTYDEVCELLLTDYSL